MLKHMLIVLLAVVAFGFVAFLASGKSEADSWKKWPTGYVYINELGWKHGHYNAGTLVHFYTDDGVEYWIGAYQLRVDKR